MKPIYNKTLFYILSFTWGLPMTLLGAVATLILMIFGKKPKRVGPAIYTTVGKWWGGLSLGMFVFTDEMTNGWVLTHEVGHSFQNCYYGPAFIFIVGIPSFVRYWYIRIRSKITGEIFLDYNDIWFEKQATQLGEKYFISWLW